MAYISETGTHKWGTFDNVTFQKGNLMDYISVILESKISFLGKISKKGNDYIKNSDFLGMKNCLFRKFHIR